MIVLVANDDVHERETVRRGLASTGHLPIATSIEDARLFLARGGRADVVVVDLTGAGRNEVLLVEEVLAAVRVVAIAGLCTPPVLARMEARGVRMLRRPFDRSDLDRAVRGL